MIYSVGCLPIDLPPTEVLGTEKSPSLDKNPLLSQLLSAVLDTDPTESEPSLVDKPILTAPKNKSKVIINGEELSGKCLVIFILGQMKNLSSEFNADQLKHTVEVIKQKRDWESEALEGEMKKAAEAAENAKTASEWGGCISQIVEWVMVIGGAFIAAFSGPVGIGIFLAGLALMAIDKGVEAATGVSFLAKALEPVANLFGQLVTELGGLFSGLLQDLGMDEKTAQMVGMVLGAVVAAVGVVAIVVCGQKIGSKIVDLLIKKITQRLPELVAQLSNGCSRITTPLTRFFESFSRGANRLANKVGVQNSDELAVHAMQGATATEVAGVAAQTGLKTWQGVSEKEVDDARASIIKITFRKALASDDLDRAMTQWSENEEWAMELMKPMSNVLEQDKKAGHFIARKIAH